MEDLLAKILSIIAALLLLSVLVMVHEFGHYSIGRLLRFKIKEFAIGMGPKLFGREKHGILYAVRAFPIGGSCKFHDEDEAISDITSFGAQKVWKRAAVIFAGPLMNILFAVILAIASLSIFGDIVPAVYSVSDGPAALAGMQEGDILIAVDGAQVRHYNDAVAKIRAANSLGAVITVERSGTQVDLNVFDLYNEEAGYNVLGITLTGARRSYSFFEAAGAAVPLIGTIIGEIFEFLGGLFSRGVQQGELLGPVGTISFIGAAVRVGLESVLRLAMLISVNLAIINLLPLPALDGGRLAFLALEGVRGKPIPQEKEGMVHFVGIMLFFALIIVLTYSDIRLMWGK